MRTLPLLLAGLLLCGQAAAHGLWTEQRRGNHEVIYGHGAEDDAFKADAARAFQEAIVEVLVRKSLKAMKQSGLKQLVVAGGVGANKQLRATLDDEAKRKRLRVYYPELEFCTDNGAMIALAGCLRLQAGTPAKEAGVFAVQPRWPLMDMSVSGK